MNYEFQIFLMDFSYCKIIHYLFFVSVKMVRASNDNIHFSSIKYPGIIENDLSRVMLNEAIQAIRLSKQVTQGNALMFETFFLVLVFLRCSISR